MRVGDYTAHILVDGQELEEHDVRFETPFRATCWIASEEGKKFSIEWWCHKETRTKGNAGWVTVDGLHCGGRSMFPGPLGDGHTAEMRGVSIGKKTRDFMFSRIQLSNDERLLDKDVPQGFGEIQLEIEHGRLVKARRTRCPNMKIPREGRFHETSNKAGHHRVSFGPERTRKEKLAISHLIVKCNDEPSLFFIFRYRPTALLQAHGIIPMALPAPDTANKGPSTMPVSHRSQSNDLQKAELQQMIQVLEDRIKRLQGQKARLSRELQSKRIKYEDSGQREQSNHAVIDLTVTKNSTF